MLRKLLSLMCLFLAFAAHAAGPMPVGDEIVNAAAEQRMLSQRLAKAYVQLGLEVLPASALEQFRDSILRFELNLDRIRPVAALVPASAPAFERLAKEWRALRAAVDVAVTRESALQASRQSVRVLDAAEALTQVLAQAGGAQASRLSLAGRQRMLSQRLAKAYLLYTSGNAAEQSRREMEQAMSEFAAGLSALAVNAASEHGEKAEIEEIGLQWEWLRTALEAEGAVSYRLIVVEASDSILAASDRLVQLYMQGSNSQVKGERQ